MRQKLPGKFVEDTSKRSVIPAYKTIGHLRWVKTSSIVGPLTRDRRLECALHGPLVITKVCWWRTVCPKCFKENEKHSERRWDYLDDDDGQE